MFSRFLTTCSAFVIASVAQAGTITFNFEAELNVIQRNDLTVHSIVDDVIDLTGGAGSITGTITFDDTFLGLDGPNIGIYGPMVVTVDGLDTSGVNPNSHTRVINGSVDWINVGYQLTSTSPVDAISLIWVDDDASVFDGVLSFPPFIDISEFETTTMFFFNPQDDPSGGFSVDRVDFDVTSLTLSEVPLPAGIPLLIGGIGLLAVPRRKRS